MIQEMKSEIDPYKVTQDFHVAKFNPTLFLADLLEAFDPD